MDENGTPCPNVVIWNAAQQSGWSCWNADHTVGWWSWSGLLSKHLGTQRHGFPKDNWWASDGNCYRQKCCPAHVHCTVPSWQVKFNSFAPVSLGSLTCESGLRWWLLVSDALADVGCIVVFFKQTHGPTLHPIQQQRIAIACIRFPHIQHENPSGWTSHLSPSCAHSWPTAPPEGFEHSILFHVGTPPKKNDHLEMVSTTRKGDGWLFVTLNTCMCIYILYIYNIIVFYLWIYRAVWWCLVFQMLRMDQNGLVLFGFNQMRDISRLLWLSGGNFQNQSYSHTIPWLDSCGSWR